MLRAAMAVVVCGYAFGGLGTGAGQHAASAGTATKTVRYRGYQLSVPASWPVYRLDQDSRQCVRYDVHAVYLGTPGTDQNCPPGLVGRTETVSIGAPAAGARPPVISQRAVVSGRVAAPARPGAPGVILQNKSMREFGVSMPASAPGITATYGSDPGIIEQVLASVRLVVPQKAASPAPSPAPSAASLAATTKPVSTAPAAIRPAPSARPATSAEPAPPATPTAAASGAAPALTASKGPLAGFDTCTAPSLKAMQAWRSKFSVSAVYIGGEEMACGYGNLSAQWVHATEAMGWSLMPTYVGPQAPCDSFSGKIDRKHAAAQGRQNAQSAVQDAVALGMGKGSPIYYDMEAYSRKKSRCVTAVLEFLDAWTRQLNAEGYISGVYSSADSAVIDLATHTTVAHHALAEPQAIWCALWDNENDLDCTPYLQAGAVWSSLRRSKQFAGAHWVKVHRIGLDIDSDLVSSAVVR